MAINERLIDTAVAGGDSFTQEVDGLILHLDANDVDSYDGDGDEWVDISTFNINPNTLTQAPPALSSPTPLISYATNDAESYIGTTTWKNLSSATYNASLGGATFSEADGSSLYFDDTTGDSVTTTYSSTGKSAVTWEGWFNLDQVGGNEALGTFSVNGGNVAIFADSTSTNTPLGYFDYVYVRHADLVGNWMHIAIKFTGWAGSYTTSAYGAGISAEVYINGSSTGTVTVTPYGQTATYNTVFRVMGSVTTYRAKGLLSEFRFYESGLSDADVLANYNHGRVNFNELETTDLELHLDADSFPEYGEAGYSNTPSTWTDSSSNSNNGTITGATFDSELGNYLEFGSGKHVTTTYDLPTSGGVSIELWFNANSGVSSLMAGNNNASNALRNGIVIGDFTGSFSNESITFYQSTGLSTGANYVIFAVEEGNTKYQDGNWHHLVLIDTGSGHEVYVDGESKTLTYELTAGGAGTRINWTNFCLGKTNFNSNHYMNGKVGQCRIYDSALSANQVKGNYLATANLYPNGYDGVLGGGTTSNKPTWNSGGYFTFDGTNDYVTTPLTQGTSTTCSFACHFRVPDVSGRKFLIGDANAAGSSITERFALELNGDEFRLIPANGTAFDALSSTSANVTANVFHHICVTISGTTVKFYFNGTLINTFTMAFSWGNAGERAYTIGSAGDYRATLLFKGDMSVVQFYDIELTQAQVTALQ